MTSDRHYGMDDRSTEVALESGTVGRASHSSHQGISRSSRASSFIFCSARPASRQQPAASSASLSAIACGVEEDAHARGGAPHSLILPRLLPLRAILALKAVPPQPMGDADIESSLFPPLDTHFCTVRGLG